MVSDNFRNIFKEPSGSVKYLTCIAFLLNLIFSVVGALTSLRWILTALVNDSHHHEVSSAQVAGVYSKVPRDLDITCTDVNQENCPWSMVFSDLTNRLQLLEMAFKEQVVARESLEREINNQTDTNVLARVQPRVKRWMTSLKAAKLKGSPKASLERKNSSAPSTPKHAFLKNELCIVLFRKDYSNTYTTMTESMLKHFEEVRLASDPFYIIECQNDIKRLPAVKLYILIFDCDGSVRCESDHELQIAAVKVIRTLGGMDTHRLKSKRAKANVVVVIANDEGSRKLVAHSMYNTNLRVVNSYEDVQELASQGRVFSMWREMTSHQMSHLRKIIRTVLNVRPIFTN
ncbi:hypothetical protein KUTeg_007383 [Tegillarca granosa]|uniref:Uncharacterized protein n=1 Tax=Tegillarca granosa TaxID=220873 RepID=A0ABQ9FD40_TEGGR|nr:hypothetical protein KUTeg_007383 [Tegillarca granosa]